MLALAQKRDAKFYQRKEQDLEVESECEDNEEQQEGLELTEEK